MIRKQEMEQRNHAIYSYMHDVFGAEVIDIFDMQYMENMEYASPDEKLSSREGNSEEEGQSKEGSRSGEKNSREALDNSEEL